MHVLAPGAAAAVRRIAATCIHDPLGASADVSRALGRQVRFRSATPWDAPAWRELLERNSLTGARTGVPLLVTQGTADRLIDPAITTAFVRRLCRNGNRVAYRALPGVDHTSAGKVTAPLAATWIAARFARRPAPSTCAR
jgi:alpha-beta hydrolase superfamily lysophospholipase